MKLCKPVSYVCAAVGVVLMICSVAGRFIDQRSVFGGIIPGGIGASHVMLGADTFLLLAVLTFLYYKKE